MSSPPLRNMARKHAMEMLLAGDPITASEALRIGLVNRIAAPEIERDRARDTAHMASNHIEWILSHFRSPHGRPGRPQRSTLMQKLVAIAFLTVIVFAPALAQAYTQEEQISCQDDAFRFCGHAIPDEQRVKACLIANMSRLTPACRRMFQRGRR